MIDVLMTSGFGQFHSNKLDINKPNKKLTPYLTIGWSDICHLANNPQQVEKTRAQWIIPSTLLSRCFKTQEELGEFWMLWADLDDNPPTLPDLAEKLVEIIDDADFELYNSRSATVENQKARLLIPLEKPLSGINWMLAQEILNDKLEALGIKTDRATERAAQLCYLPNRGAFYYHLSKRNGVVV